MDYKAKYLKYKTKYLKLKQIGGEDDFISVLQNLMIFQINLNAPDAQKYYNAEIQKYDPNNECKPEADGPKIMFNKYREQILNLIKINKYNFNNRESIYEFIYKTIGDISKADGGCNIEFSSQILNSLIKKSEDSPPAETNKEKIIKQFYNTLTKLFTPDSEKYTNFIGLIKELVSSLYNSIYNSKTITDELCVERIKENTTKFNQEKIRLLTELNENYKKQIKEINGAFYHKLSSKEREQINKINKKIEDNKSKIDNILNPFIKTIEPVIISFNYTA